MVKDSGLRGRGGAGFPTGMKWSFIPQDNPKPKYLVVNADESEPGTCKDIPLMMASPHTLVEGVIISAYAIRANYAFIYVRGEVLHVVRRLQQAVREAYSAGYAGDDILGTGYNLEVIVHAGAGAYICGEETALLDSLEGRRGQPRLRPPFPAIAGLYASPTVINNVESIASVPSIIANGPDWFSLDGHREVARHDHLLVVRARGQTRPVRGAAGHHAAPAARSGRRHARRAPTQVLDARRLVDADADARAPGYPVGLRGRGQREVDARHQGPAVLRRDHLGGAGRAALDRVLQARVVRQVHAVPRGHVVAGADPEADGGRPRARRATSRSSSTCARTSSAGRSAPSATAPPRPSPRPSPSSGRSSNRRCTRPPGSCSPTSGPPSSSVSRRGPRHEPLTPDLSASQLAIASSDADKSSSRR